MVSVLDESVGNLTQALERLGLLEDTIIFFTSDVIFSF
jgi:arylsulfatase A-like enzyme